MCVIHNEKMPTWRRGAISSYIDVTACSEGLINQISEWRVANWENLSDHADILFFINLMQKTKHIVQGKYERGWRISQEGMESFDYGLQNNLMAIDGDMLSFVVPE